MQALVPLKIRASGSSPMKAAVLLKIEAYYKEQNGVIFYPLHHPWNVQRWSLKIPEDLKPQLEELKRILLKEMA